MRMPLAICGKSYCAFSPMPFPVTFHQKTVTLRLSWTTWHRRTLLRVIDKLDTFEGRSQFTSWVYKIAIRVALSELRLSKWKEVSLDGLEEGPEPGQMPSEKFASSKPGPEAIAEQKDAMGMVRQIIQEELTPRQRTIMMAINVQGVPMDVVAQRMGTNRNALYKMMHDARLKLKHCLEREGLPPEELLKMFGN